MIATSPKFRTPDCPFSSIQCKDLLQVTHWCGTRNGRTWAPQWPVWCSSRSASWTWNLGFGCKLGWKSETCSTCIEVCTFWPSYNTVPHYLLCFYCISVGCFFSNPRQKCMPLLARALSFSLLLGTKGNLWWPKMVSILQPFVMQLRPMIMVYIHYKL